MGLQDAGDRGLLERGELHLIIGNCRRSSNEWRCIEHNGRQRQPKGHCGYWRCRGWMGCNRECGQRRSAQERTGRLNRIFVRDYRGRSRRAERSSMQFVWRTCKKHRAKCQAKTGFEEIFHCDHPKYSSTQILSTYETVPARSRPYSEYLH